jgi:N-methylhydantoinase B
VVVEDDTATFDLSGAADETRGPVNLTPPYTDTSIFYALIALTDPDAGFNDGMRRAVRILRRPGSVLDPRFPAPVGAAQSMKQRFTDLCFEALCKFAPERSIAHSGGSGGTLGISWSSAAGGARALQYEVFGSGMGAMHGRDGTSGIAVYTSNLAMTPIEVIESMFPVRVRRFELATDSGGPGTWRGGLSYRREYEALADGVVMRRAERAKFPASGVEDGWSGHTAKVELVDTDGTARDVPVAGRYELRPGQSIRIQGAGAGGFGPPGERDPEAVRRDVESALVSVEGAARDYGVVFAEDGSVDGEATAARRQAGLEAPAPVLPGSAQ